MSINYPLCRCVVCLIFQENYALLLLSVGEGETEANRGGNKITPSTNWEQVKVISFRSKLYKHTGK